MEGLRGGRSREGEKGKPWITFQIHPSPLICVEEQTAHRLCLIFLPDVEMLQASAGNPVSRESFSRPTKDSMIRKFLEGKL